MAREERPQRRRLLGDPAAAAELKCLRGGGSFVGASYSIHAVSKPGFNGGGGRDGVTLRWKGVDGQDERMKRRECVRNTNGLGLRDSSTLTASVLVCGCYALNLGFLFKEEEEQGFVVELVIKSRGERFRGEMLCWGREFYSSQWLIYTIF